MNFCKFVNKKCNMTNISERIKMVLNYYGLNSGEFASKLNIQKSSVSHLLSGRNKPSFVFLSKFVQVFPEINIKWLLTGESNMLENSDYSIDNQENKKQEIKSEIDEGENYKQVSKNILPPENQTNTGIKSIIMVYDDDTFKILKKN